ncbi:gamma-glutamyltransferase family protein [Halostreptopolyspora alba]|uniref:Gamma-glutamyltransferase family protein n=1 Tax=Halostreptopolyspora alba TaxID=2487137 RepID=A0A3N0E6J4_9ACTN|nr:gamma-glutamyltransferase family protein [Nocardiopsaceae bacterium YIM 96095]
MSGFTSRPELRGDFGMVSSTHWLASAAGMSVLERGGNAFDAAVATGFTLQVVEPHMNGPGGEVPAVFQPAGGTPTVLCGQGPAPAAAVPDAFDGLHRIPGSGVLPATVPGAFDAWLLLLRDHGTLPLRDVLDHAIGHARRGVAMIGPVADKIAEIAKVFTRFWPSSAALYLSRGLPTAGSRHPNPALAACYQRIVEESERSARTREARIDAARAIWREGFVAEEILTSLDGPVPDSTGTPHHALLTGDDLATWSASYETPTSLDYAGHTVHKTGPWGQGPVFLQQLRLAESLGVAELDTLSPEFVHTVTEAAKLAFADREAWYGDPNFVDVPLAELTSRGYAEQRAALVDDTASAELRPGSPNGHTPFVPDPRIADAAVAGRTSEGVEIVPSGEQRGDTCHLDVVDAAGNMVSATPSGGWLHGSPVIGNLGFPLGTRGQMFWLDPRSPSVIAPGKRPRTTLSPTLVTRAGQGVLALGTPGGDQQDQWTFNFFLRVMHTGMNLQEAIDSPMFHGNSFPSSFYPREMAPAELVAESRFGERAVAELERRGHRVSVSDAWSLGRLAAVARDPGTGELCAGADPRAGQGYAAGR